MMMMMITDDDRDAMHMHKILWKTSKLYLFAKTSIG